MSDNLSLKIVLEAADKMTAPVRRILGVTSSLEDQLAATRRELRDLNAAQKDLASYDKLTEQMTDVGASMNLAQQRVGKYENNITEAKTSSREFRTELSRAEIELNDLRKQMDLTGPPSKQLVEQFTRAEKTVNTLNKRIATADGNVDKYSASLTKAQIALKRTETRQKTYNEKLKDTAGRLKTAGINTDNLKEEQKRLSGVVDTTTRSLNEQSKAAGKLAAEQRKVKNITAQRDKVMQRAQAMTVSGAGSMHTGRSIVRETLEQTAGAAIDDEAAFGGVKKVVEFANPEAAQKFRKELQLMSMDMPTAATGLYDIAEAGGQLGVKQEDLKEFTNTTAVMSIAFDMVASKTGKSMATLSNVYDMPINEMREVGDAINHLSNNTAAKAGDIVDTVARIGGVSKEFGLTVIESSALADAMISLGKAPDVAATGINALLLKMQTARIQGKPFKKGLVEIGMTAEELEGKVRNNAQGALVEFLETLEKLPDANRMNVIGQMFGAEYADDISALVGSMGNYKKALNLVAKEANYAGSMQAEFDSKNASTKAGLQKLDNQLDVVRVSLGSGLLPMINDILKQARPMIQTFMDWTQANPELTKTILMSVLAIGALAAAGGALTMMVAGLLGPFAMMRYAMAMIGVKGLGVVSIFKTLGKVFMWLGRAFLMNPIGLAITAIAGGAYLIYKNWDVLKNWWNTTSWKQKIFDVASFLSPIGLMSKGAKVAWDWWQGTEWGQKSLKVVTPMLDTARAAGDQALNWWNTASWTEKSLTVATPMLSVARVAGTASLNWWLGTKWGQKSLKVATPMLDTARAAGDQALNWWNTTSWQEKRLAIATPMLTVARTAGDQALLWWNTTSWTQKSLDVATAPISMARISGAAALNWWLGTKWGQKSLKVATPMLDTARAAGDQALNWWNTTSWQEKRLAVATPMLAVARTAGDQALLWWNTTSWAQKSLDVATAPISMARISGAAALNWWLGTKWGQKSLKVVTPMIATARASGEQALTWWLGTKWGQKSLDVGTSILEAAKKLAEDFVKMWNSFSLKSLIPDIKWPELPSWMPGSGKSGSKSKARIQSVVSSAPLQTQTIAATGAYAGYGDMDYAKYGGTRATGGPVAAGEFYQVNELGPELLTMGGKTYLMAHQAGSVTAISHQASPQNMQSNIINNATGQTVESSSLSSSVSNIIGASLSNLSNTVGSTASNRASHSIESTVNNINRVATSTASNSINKVMGHSAGNTLNHLFSNAMASNDSRYASVVENNSASRRNGDQTNSIRNLGDANQASINSTRLINNAGNASSHNQTSHNQTINSMSGVASGAALSSTTNQLISSTMGSINKATGQMFESSSLSSSVSKMIGASLNNLVSNTTAGNDARYVSANTNIRNMLGASASNNASEVISYAANSNVASNDSNQNSALSNRFGDSTNVTDLLAMQSSHYQNSSQAESSRSSHIEAPMDVKIVVNATPGMDANEVAAIVERKLKTLEREHGRRARGKLYDAG